MKRALVAAGVVALALSLAACSEDEPEPEVGPAGSTSPSTPETSPTEPPDKEPWEKNTRAGAVAFVKHWFEVFSDSMDDGNVTELSEISSPKCVTCRRFVNLLESTYGNGGFYRSDGWKVRSVDVGPTDGLPEGEYLTLLRLSIPEERLKESADAEVVKSGATQTDMTARARWTRGRWVMTSLVELT